jgi:uncharacterized protein
MIEVGNYAKLEVVRFVDFGAYLDGGALGEILIPRRYFSDDVKEGDELDVFIYCDSEDRIIATTETPIITVNEIGNLTIVDNNAAGAFADWGIAKDLLIPFREQAQPLERGKSYPIICLYDHKSGRLFGSTKLAKYNKNTEHDFKVGQSIEFLVHQRTDLGYKIVIENEHQGLLYHNEVFQPMKVGEKHNGFIKTLRDDGKIDVTMQAQGYRNHISNDTDYLMKILSKTPSLKLTDKSRPEEVYEVTKMSKKAFKKAVGNLYKQKLIVLEKDGIRLK